MSQPAWRHSWERRTLGLALRVNATACLDAFAPGAFISASASAVCLYALRRHRVSLEASVWLLLAGLFLSALLALWLRRKAFFSRRDARIFLEYHLGLNTALSAAEAGIGKWPDPRGPFPRILRRKSLAPFAWLLLSVALLAASLHLPVPPPPHALQSAEKAPAIAEVERLIEELKQSDLVDAASLERLASEARQLAERPPEQQYSHSGLEAADQLRDQTLAETQELANNLDKAAKSFEDAEKSAQNLSDSQAQKDAQGIENALKGMRSGQLSANDKLQKQLQGVNAQQLQKMSKDQLSKMKQAMKQAGKQARGISGAQKKSQVAKGSCEKVGPGQGTQAGDQPGNGGDPVPLAFTENASPGQDGKVQLLQNDDYSRASLGDNMQTTDGQHQVDPAKAAQTQSAGGFSNKAQGGDAVWVNRLTPAERAALKDFFK